MQWKYLSSIEARERVSPSNTRRGSSSFRSAQEIKSGYRAVPVKGTREKICVYVCIVFFAVEPTAYIKGNGTKNMTYPAQECFVGKMCSCLRRAFSIPMMFPRKTGARVGGSDLVGNRLGRQILQGRFFRVRKKKKRKETKQLKEMRTNVWYFNFACVVGASMWEILTPLDIESRGYSSYWSKINRSWR